MNDRFSQNNAYQSTHQHQLNKIHIFVTISRAVQLNSLIHDFREKENILLT